MKTSLPTRAFAIAAYALFALATAAFVAFLLDIGPWKTIGRGDGFGAPWLANPLLIALWALHHSLFARAPVKRWLERRLPPGSERALYVAAASALLLLLIVGWQPLPEPLWQPRGELGRAALLAALALGWTIVVAATFEIDHAALFGLRQAFGGAARDDGGFVTPWMYRRVRHPMMTGFLLALWTVPDFSVGHAQLAFALTLYVVVGTRLD